MIRRALAVLWLSATAILAGCSEPPSVEQQVVAAIQELEALGEAGDRGGFMDGVAEDFQGQGGAMTRDEFGALLVLQWNQHRRIRAQLFPIEVTELGPALATAQFRVLLTGGGGLIPESGRLYDVETTWSAEGGDWLLWRASWASAHR